MVHRLNLPADGESPVFLSSTGEENHQMIRRVSAATAALLIVGLLAPMGASARTVQSRPFQTSKSPDLAFVANDALYRAFQSGQISEAGYALERARSLFSLAEVRKSFGRVARVQPQAATLILRDLALRLKNLSGAERKTAMAILARPSEPDDEFSYEPDTDMSTCTTSFCIHWASGGLHAPDLTDADANGIPDWVDGIVAEFEIIVGSYAATGYTPVKSDLSSPDNGGNGLPDIYLADVGDAGIYGFCTTDDPNVVNLGGSYAGFDVSAYCVIDEDFNATQFPSNTPFENMQVTAAHEFFHAVQFAYDIGEDIWFLEATSAWIEDVVYDDINDNYQYLITSPLSYPDIPIDLSDSGELSLLKYGQFLFIRYLTELLGDVDAQNVDIVREMWERAAFREGHPEDVDDYSVLAIENVLAAHGFDFAEVFGDFGAFNWMIELFYEEGVDYFDFLVANGFSPRPYVVKAHKVSKGKPKTGGWKYNSLHLSTANVTFKPTKGVKSNAKLLIKVDGPSSAASPEFRYIVFKKSGLPGIFNFPVDGQGVGKKKVPFGKGTVTLVVLVMTNASTRYQDCYTYQTPFACGGANPQDDGAPFKWSGTLKQ
jgi:hypothetical protein